MTKQALFHLACEFAAIGTIEARNMARHYLRAALAAGGDQ